MLENGLLFKVWVKMVIMVGTNWQYDAASTLMSKSCSDVGFGSGVERRL